MRRSTTAYAILAAVTALSTVMSALPAQADSATRHVIDVMPAWATSSTDAGPMAATTTIDARVYLASRDEAGLDAFVAAVSNPDSAQYQQYLTPADAAARFGAPDGAADRVSSWLKSVKLTVTGANQHWVSFSGSAATVNAAFGTRIDNFTVNGKTVYAPSSQASVPSTIATDVLTVLGLSAQLVDNSPTLVQDPIVGPTDLSGNAAPDGTDAKAFPCNDYEGQAMAKKYPKAYGAVQPYAVCGYQPKQLRGAYGADASGFTGKGINTVVVDAYALPTMKKDFKKWTKKRGEPKLKKGQYKEYVPAGTPYNSGWAGEEALDIEAIHSMAPDANIRYVAAINSGDSAFLDAFDTIIDKKLGDFVNNSWGGGSDQQTPPSVVAAFEQRFKLGASEGIGFYFSSGDDGGLSGGQPFVMYPSIDPFVTSVGGSSIGIDQNNKYMWETSWENDYSTLSADGKSWTPAPPGNYSSGAGGGTSRVFAQPKWQQGVVPDKFSQAFGSTRMRTVPDIGALGDPTTGFLEGYSGQVGGKWVYGENRIGGTSLSSPLIIGMQAVAEQAGGGKAFGFANPAIYKLAGTNAYNDVTDTPLGPDTRIAHVRTITSGGATVVALGTAGNSRDAGLWSIKGYDTTTGVGTPTKNYYLSFK